MRPLWRLISPTLLTKRRTCHTLGAQPGPVRLARFLFATGQQTGVGVFQRGFFRAGNGA
jgi:hypothetical protein